MNYCTNCGKKLKEGTKFCTNCGNKVEEIEEQKAEIKTTNNEKKQNKKFPVWGIVLIVIGAFFLVFIFAIIMFFVAVSNSNFDFKEYNNENAYDDRYNKDDISLNQQGTIGDTLTGENFSVKLIEAEKYDTLSTIVEDYTPAEGNIYIVYYLKATNVSDSKDFFNYLYWTAEADGKKVEYKNVIGEINDYSWCTGSVEKGESITGYIVFEVPKDFKSFKATYDEDPYIVSSSFTFSVVNN